MRRPGRHGEGQKYDRERKRRQRGEEKERKRLENAERIRIENAIKYSPEDLQKENEIRERENKKFNERVSLRDSNITISLEEQRAGLDEFFRTIEEWESTEEEDPVERPDKDKIKIREDLRPSEVEWLRRHEDVSERGISPNMYGRKGRDSKEYILNADGSLEEISKKEDGKKEKVWKFF